MILSHYRHILIQKPIIVINTSINNKLEEKIEALSIKIIVAIITSLVKKNITVIIKILVIILIDDLPARKKCKSFCAISSYVVNGLT